MKVWVKVEGHPSGFSGRLASLGVESNLMPPAGDAWETTPGAGWNRHHQGGMFTGGKVWCFRDGFPGEMRHAAAWCWEKPGG